MARGYKMACYYPLVAMRDSEENENGKRPIRIIKSSTELNERYLKEAIKAKRLTLIPCGRCIGCKLEKARQWAVRCVHESQMHDENCFITLTFNNENLPKNGSVDKRDLQLFFKRLRKFLKTDRVRYFASGEYGDKTGRPHYHICLFGYDFKDKELIYSNQTSEFAPSADYKLYTSKTLERVWQNKGFVTIGSLTFESAGYVARYCLKKITGKKQKSHYNGREPEFALMSRNNGIGFSWFEKYKTDVYPKDFFTINGCKQKPVRYYDYLLETKDGELFVKIKDERMENGQKKELTYRRLMEMDHFKKLQTKTLQRSI